MTDHMEREREARAHLDAAMSWFSPTPTAEIDAYCAAVRAARDAEWRAAVERVRRVPYVLSGPTHGWEYALDALLQEVDRDEQ